MLINSMLLDRSLGNSRSGYSASTFIKNSTDLVSAQWNHNGSTSTLSETSLPPPCPPNVGRQTNSNDRNAPSTLLVRLYLSVLLLKDCRSASEFVLSRT